MPTATLDRELFREVIGHFASGVTVVTARAGDKPVGMTASAMSSLSLDPPMLLVCLYARSTTGVAVAQSGRFCVNVLADHQDEVARLFARPASAGDKFSAVAWRSGRLGVPLLEEALACFECEVAEEVAGTTHHVFLAHVVHAEAREGAPLAYYRGSFGRLQMEADARATRELREHVLGRRYEPGALLDLDALAADLDVARVHVHSALVQLAAEGLVSRAADGGYVITPLTEAVSDDAFDARCAIELGVADMTVGRVDRDPLAELRRLMEATLGLIADGRFTDVEAYVRANAAFHEHMVSLAGSGALLDAYRRLSLPAIMGRLFTRFPAASEQLLDDHRALVDAYERGDLEAARDVVVAHAERAKEANSAAIRAAGGVV